MDKGGTDSSNDTDATLVDDGPSRTILGPSTLLDSPGKSSSSVLGKRPRDLHRQRSEMEVDSPLSQSPKERDGFVLVSANDDDDPPEVPSSSTEGSKPEASLSKVHVVDKDGEAKMSASVTPKPPLPPRKRVEQTDSTMMFGENYMARSTINFSEILSGKQHDVAECMDNCMFQIETALLKFDDMSESSDKTSVVKRCVFWAIIT